MDIGDCYRLLGLRSGASFAEIKASYRRLVQQYHPDLNPDDEKCKEKFIALTEAYKLLQTVVPPEEIAVKSHSSSSLSSSSPSSTSSVFEDSSTQVASPPSVSTTVMPHPPTSEDIEERLKWKTYEQLQRFLQEKRFPQAIALVEALAARLPGDIEVKQWQAISYQIWGRALIAQKQLPKARIYLKKAIKTDPHNKALFNEVQRDFERLGIKF
ncbi:heat shock protein DnaJ domain-containing protein [Sphaerospermopsis reniformis]|uniref:Heat shock protein DnaJ domain-containing protein n=1 Tax=Sphaerospermopsis reniformis TaxID=531300 RepID=A0A479ZYA9_9CYAN|nr:J domain-containing protein [Sphaerospermopsis reniformis]GCL37770.1 heat shock protein DnaJ domain-containing protein [Sphaerospermopsis reniformis]